jgi:hypothetical protein
MTETTRIESRWPPIVAIFAVVVLLEGLPDRLRLLPIWGPYVVAVLAIAPMVAVTLAPTSVRWPRIERLITFLFVVTVMAATIVGLAALIRTMVVHPDMSGLTLLTSSIAVWAVNVLIFSLLYWQLDRGGPTARAGNLKITPDWIFPQEGAPAETLPGWRPTYVDYFFLGFSTATAFSTTDSMPLTARAKMLMVLESTVSLLTIVMVAARAINIIK